MAKSPLCQALVLKLKGTVKIDNNPLRLKKFIVTVIGLKSQCPSSKQYSNSKSNDPNIQSKILNRYKIVKIFQYNNFGRKCRKITRISLEN